MPPKKGSQCKKPENPCKICLQAVTTKTGLQCSGACRTWVHYECVHYTPGKIKDIKDGTIRVTCPCPDCETRLPKEYRVDKPTCANLFCPANSPQRCEHSSCPNDSPPAQDNMNQTIWPLRECGAECKKHMNYADDPNPKPWPVAKCGPTCKLYTSDGSSAPQAQKPIPMRQSQKPLSQRQTQKPSGREVRGDCCEAEGTPSFSVVGQMCSTIGLLAKQMNTLMVKMQEFSKMSESKPESRPASPDGCHDIPPCQKVDSKKGGGNCCCSGGKT